MAYLASSNTNLGPVITPTTPQNAGYFTTIQWRGTFGTSDTTNYQVIPLRGNAQLWSVSASGVAKTTNPLTAALTITYYPNANTTLYPPTVQTVTLRGLCNTANTHYVFPTFSGITLFPPCTSTSDSVYPKCTIKFVEASTDIAGDVNDYCNITLTEFNNQAYTYVYQKPQAPVTTS